MKVKFLENTVAAQTVVERGQVMELPQREADKLIRMKRAKAHEGAAEADAAGAETQQTEEKPAEEKPKGRR